MTDLDKILRSKPLTPSGPSYRFTHRPEGWKIEFELVGVRTHVVGYYPTESDAIRALNMALGEAGLIRYRFNGGAL